MQNSSKSCRKRHLLWILNPGSSIAVKEKKHSTGSKKRKCTHKRNAFKPILYFLLWLFSTRRNTLNKRRKTKPGPIPNIKNILTLVNLIKFVWRIWTLEERSRLASIWRRVQDQILKQKHVELRRRFLITLVFPFLLLSYACGESLQSVNKKQSKTIPATSLKPKTYCIYHATAFLFISISQISEKGIEPI